jgi:hypothetical protein
MARFAEGAVEHAAPVAILRARDRKGNGGSGLPGRAIDVPPLPSRL